MCTALSLLTFKKEHLFGRNMDLAYSFNQAVTLVPRNYEYRDRVTGNMKKNKYAIIHAIISNNILDIFFFMVCLPTSILLFLLSKSTVLWNKLQLQFPSEASWHFQCQDHFYP